MPTREPRKRTDATKPTSNVLDQSVNTCEPDEKPGKDKCAPCRVKYQWFSAPRSIYNVKKFKRDPPSANKEAPPVYEPYKNLMFERRVVRGTNFGPPQPEVNPCLTLAEFRRRQCLRLRCKQRNQRNVIGTPPPVDGRRHERIQTERYLEELYERPPEYDVNTQTDLFLERPVTPPFIPEKVGIDVGTEILEGDLFDFDREVQPILETLVGHCVEQGILEVTHEEEVADLHVQQQEFLAEREQELCELRRLEAEELRLQAEKERRLRQDCIARELDSKMQKNVTAAKLLQGHIASLLPEVLSNLEPATDEARKCQLEKNICPWLTKQIAEEVGQIVDSREILTEIIREILKQRAMIYMDYVEEEIDLGEEEMVLDECGLGNNIAAAAQAAAQASAPAAPPPPDYSGLCPPNDECFK